jgi:hypothetical protein
MLEAALWEWRFLLNGGSRFAEPLEARPVLATVVDNVNARSGNISWQVHDVHQLEQTLAVAVGLVWFDRDGVRRERPTAPGRRGEPGLSVDRQARPKSWGGSLVRAQSGSV